MPDLKYSIHNDQELKAVTFCINEHDPAQSYFFVTLKSTTSDEQKDSDKFPLSTENFSKLSEILLEAKAVSEADIYEKVWDMKELISENPEKAFAKGYANKTSEGSIVAKSEDELNSIALKELSDRRCTKRALRSADGSVLLKDDRGRDMSDNLAALTKYLEETIAPHVITAPGAIIMQRGTVTEPFDITAAWQSIRMREHRARHPDIITGPPAGKPGSPTPEHLMTTMYARQTHHTAHETGAQAEATIPTAQVASNVPIAQEAPTDPKAPLAETAAAKKVEHNQKPAM